MISKPAKRVRKSSEADRTRAAKWNADHPEHYRNYQKEYADRNREFLRRYAREKYAEEHPPKRITKYRKKVNGEVILRDKEKLISPSKLAMEKSSKSVETFTSNPSIIAHVRWLQEHRKQN